MKPPCCRLPRGRRGFAALIEIIIVAALILGGLALYLSFSGGYGKMPDVGGPVGDQPASVPGRAIQKAHSMECQQDLRQLRMLINMSKGEGESGGYPQSLEAMPEASKIRTCPVGGEPYTYDPTTGRVSCPHPGHEGY